MNIKDRLNWAPNIDLLGAPNLTAELQIGQVRLEFEIDQHNLWELDIWVNEALHINRVDGRYGGGLRLDSAKRLIAEEAERIVALLNPELLKEPK